MKKTRFTEEQMVTILREADQRPVPEVAKKHGVSAQTIEAYRLLARPHFLGGWGLWDVQVGSRRRCVSAPSGW